MQVNIPYIECLGLSSLHIQKCVRRKKGRGMSPRYSKLMSAVWELWNLEKSSRKTVECCNAGMWRCEERPCPSWKLTILSCCFFVHWLGPICWFWRGWLERSDMARHCCFGCFLLLTWRSTSNSDKLKESAKSFVNLFLFVPLVLASLIQVRHWD